MKENKISQAARSAAVPAEVAPYRILVAHDDNDLRQLSAELLTSSGYEVDIVADAHAAWKALTTYHYDLLITEQKLRHMTGVELVAKLRIARMAVPVILASPVFPPLKFNRYPWLQPAVTLPMPFTVTEFLGTVQEVLHARTPVRAQSASPGMQSPPEGGS